MSAVIEEHRRRLGKMSDMELVREAGAFLEANIGTPRAPRLARLKKARIGVATATNESQLAAPVA